MTGPMKPQPNNPYVWKMSSGKKADTVTFGKSTRLLICVFRVSVKTTVSTAKPEPEIDLKATHAELVEVEKEIKAAKDKHNAFLEELGLPPLP